MRLAIRIPQAGTSTEATFLEWDIGVGDSVKTDDRLGTAETDKVVLEILAERDGVIDELIAEAGQEVDVAEPLGYLRVEGDDSHGAETELSTPSESAADTRPEGGATADATDGASEDDDAAEERQPLTPVRRRIAENLDWVVRNTAIAWTSITVDYEAVEALRTKWSAGFKKKAGHSLTYLPFVAAATCDALSRHPALITTIAPEGGELIVHKHVNLGIGVATDSGLLVPVVAGAHRLGFQETAEAIAAAIDRARKRKLAPSDLQGGTFTITNPGSLGSALSVPIMNRGETAILSVDAITPSAVVVEDEIVIRKRGMLGLSFDHRIVDGAAAIAFLRDVRDRLEEGAFEWS